MPKWDDPNETMNKDDHLVYGAFKLTRECGFWTWERKEEMLKALYQTLRGTHSPWVKPEDRVF